MKLDLKVTHFALDLVLFASVDLFARYLWVGVNAREGSGPDVAGTVC